jgi:methylglyoxal reductase
MIRHEIEESLRRLKTDWIDLYQTHWQDSTTKTEDVMAELLLLKQEGKIRAIGCSNATIEQMERYQSVGQLDTDQEQYSMLQRQHEADNLPYCRDHNVALLAYSPMALGILSGKIGPNHEFGDGDVRRGNPWYQKENRPKVDALLEVIRSVAEGKGITIAQTVIAWTLEQPGCSHALVGARNPDQAIANAKAGTVTLTEEEVRIIRKVVNQTKL